MKKIQPRIIKNNEASESNLREFYKEDLDSELPQTDVF